jgi:hypothetical protein
LNCGIIERLMLKGQTYLLAVAQEKVALTLKSQYQLFSLYSLVGNSIRKYSTKKKDFDIDTYDFMPKSFRETFKRVLKDIREKEEPLPHKVTEEKYNDHLKELLMEFFGIMWKFKDPEERSEALDTLKQKYLKGLE